MGRRRTLGRAAPGDDEREKRRSPDLDRHVRSGEEQTAAPERVGDGDGHHEAREHEREHEQSHDDRVGIEHVRDPRRVGPRPPDHEQDEERPPGSTPRQVVEQQMRDLRDGEDEDEVVEELEVRRVRFLVGRARSEVSAHGLRSR